MAKVSYLRALTGPPAADAAVLRPPHKPAWGLSTAFGQHRLDGNLVQQSSFPSPSVTATDREDPQPASAKSDRRITPGDPEPVSLSPQRQKVEEIAAAATRNRESETAARTGRSQQDLGPDEKAGLLSPHPGPVSSASSKPRQGSSNAPFGQTNPARQSEGVDQGDQKTPGLEKLEHLTAQLQAAVRKGNSPSGQLHPRVTNAPSSHDAKGRADGTTSVHIGAIDIRLAPPAQAPKRVSTRPAAVVPSTLSRGFHSSYGLRQG